MKSSMVARLLMMVNSHIWLWFHFQSHDGFNEILSNKEKTITPRNDMALFNPLNPKSDQHQISPFIINAL